MKVISSLVAGAILAIIPAVSLAATDTFTRVVGSGWGTADTGGAWTADASPASFSVGGTSGRLGVAAAWSEPRDLPRADCGRLGCEDGCESRQGAGRWWQRVAVPRGAPFEQQHGRVPPGRPLRGERQHVPDASRVVSGTETQIGSAVVVPTVNFLTGFTLRGQVTGTNPTTIRIKAWVGTEPETWQYTATDSLGPQVAGRGGLRGYTSGSTTQRAAHVPARQLQRQRGRLPAASAAPAAAASAASASAASAAAASSASSAASAPAASASASASASAADADGRHLLARRREWLGHGRYRWCVDGRRLAGELLGRWHVGPVGALRPVARTGRSSCHRLRSTGMCTTDVSLDKAPVGGGSAWIYHEVRRSSSNTNAYRLVGALRRERQHVRVRLAGRQRHRDADRHCGRRADGQLPDGLHAAWSGDGHEPDDDQGQGLGRYRARDVAVHGDRQPRPAGRRPRRAARRTPRAARPTLRSPSSSTTTPATRRRRRRPRT